MEKLLKRHFPLFFENSDCLITYKSGVLYRYSITNDSFSIYTKLGINPFFEKYLSKSKLLSRFFRLGIRASIKLQSGIFLLCFGTKIYEYDCNSNQLQEGCFDFSKSRPLNFTEIVAITGFTDGVVFGEYFGNSIQDEVKIYKRMGVNSWETAFAFPAGLINHIHNIIPDQYNNCLWILTGDFGNSIGIWKATDNFNLVVPVLTGDQDFRACQAWPTPKGLLYVTDSPFKQNYLKLLTQKEGIAAAENIAAVNGSVIYGGIINNQPFFSSTVESNGIYKNKLEVLFSFKRGDSIKDNFSYLYVYDYKELKIVYKAEKDMYPFAPFQFGTLFFPQGTISGSLLPVFHVATKKNDLSTLLLSI